MKLKKINFPVLLIICVFCGILPGSIKAPGSKKIKSLSSTYKIAFSSTLIGRGDIYFSDLEGKEKLRITDHPYQDGYPDCSPDGKNIAFYSYADSSRKTWSIYIMNLNGMNRKRLTFKQNVYDGRPDWSPDGSQILFISNRTGNYNIFIMNTDGSDVQNVSKNKHRNIQGTWLISTR